MTDQSKAELSSAGVPESMIPKDATKTSSFRLVIASLAVALLMPLPPVIVALLLTRPWFPAPLAPIVEGYMTEALLALSGVLGVSGIYAFVQTARPYIEGRSMVTMAKVEAVRQIVAPAAAPTTAPSTTINVEQGVKTDDQQTG